MFTTSAPLTAEWPDLRHGTGRAARGSNLQDILRLLTLWFSHGTLPDVEAALQEGFNMVSIDTWLKVIPQVGLPGALIVRPVTGRYLSEAASFSAPVCTSGLIVRPVTQRYLSEAAPLSANVRTPGLQGGPEDNRCHQRTSCVKPDSDVLAAAELRGPASWEVAHHVQLGGLRCHWHMLWWKVDLAHNPSCLWSCTPRSPTSAPCTGSPLPGCCR